MKRKFTILIAAIAAILMITQPTRLWGQSVTLNFTSNTWSLPTDYTTGTVNYTDTGTGKTITMYAASNGWKFNGTAPNGSNLFGKNGSYLQLPAFDFPVKKIVVVGKSGASSKVTQNIFVGTTAVSTSTTGATGTYTYNINSSYQAAGNVYRLKVTNANNTQVTQIKVYRACTVTYNANGGSGTMTDSNSPYAEGDEVTLKSNTFTAPSGYTFNGWLVKDASNNTITVTNNKFTMPASNVTVTAQWSSSGDYITVSPTTATPTCAAQDVEFSVDTDQTLDDDPTQFYTTSTGNVTASKPAWIGDILYDDGELVVEVSANTGAARTAYFKVEKGSVKSDVITINQAAYAPAAPTLPAAGNFDYTKEITITVPSGTTVYYTLDGTDPTSSSTQYNGAFTINATTTVKAVAYDNGYPSTVVSATYTRTYHYVSDISTNGISYTVKGTVVATNSRGFILGDNTDYIYVFLYNKDNNPTPTVPSVDEEKSVSGTITNYGHVFEYPYTATVSATTGSAYTTDIPTQIDGDDMYDVINANSSTYYRSGYKQFVGLLSYSDGYYNIAVSGNDNNATARIAYPTSSQTTTLSGLTGKTVKVIGYFAGVSSGTYSVTLESVEAVPVLTTSVSSISNFTYNYGGGPDAKSFTVAGANLTDDITVSTNSENFEISSDNSSWQTSNITISKESGTVAATTIYVRLKSNLSSNTYNGKITVSSDGADDKEIALTGTVKHTIAISGSITNGSVESDPSDAAVAGATVTLTATPDANYKLGSFTVTKAGSGTVDVTSTGANTGTYTMPADNVTVSATFVPAYTVTYAANGGSGTMTDENSPYIEGAQVTLLSNTFTYAGHTWSSWSVKDASQNTVAVSEGKFTMPASNVTVTAQWTVGQYNVALSEIGNVTLLASYGSGNTITEGKDADIDYGTEITLSATDLAAGKVFVWNVVDLLDNDVTEDVLNGDVLTVPDYDIIIGGQVAELFFKYSGDLTEGDYIIANGNYAMKNTLNSKRFNKQSISPLNNQIIVADASAYLWHIASSEDYWTIYNAAEEKYAVGTGTASQIDLGGNSDDHCLFSVSGTTTYTFENKYNKDQSVNAYLRDGGTYWACYASGTANTLYKKAVGSKHSVVCATGLSYGSVSASPSSAYEGQPVALTATPDAGYMLDSWNVYKTDDASTKVSVKNNSFVMPGYDVTVSATFRVQHTYTLVDGSTVTVEPGKHYIIVGTNSDNYYAMSAQNGSIRSCAPAVLSGSKILEHSDFYEVVISGSGTSAEPYTMYSVRDKGYLYSTGASSANIGTRADNVTTNPSYGQWTISISLGTATISSKANEGYTAFQYNHNKGNNRFACYSGNQTAVKLYVKDDDDDIAYYSPTSITVNDADADDTPITVLNNEILTLTGTITCTDPANIVIEDGGQLIHTTAAVKATLHKEVTGYGANPSVTTGWYTIASPVVGLSASTVATTEDYDLFAYQESNFTWLNTQNHTLTFAEGQGFLYANSANQTLSYAGSMKATNAEVSIDLSYTAGAGALAGYNLVGNPFSRNLTSGEVKVGGSAITTYYVSEGGSNLTPRAIADYPIKPGQGFFVQATGIEQQIVFNPGSKDYASTNKPAFISIEASNSNFTDRAYVQLGGGNTLRKMSVNDNVHSLYVMQDGKDYASATIDSYNGSIPVCFKATETGRYTITVQTTGIDADYLHLIDRYTGVDVDLLAEPSYTFIATKDDYESRFTLVFTANGSDTNDDIFAYQSGSDIVVNGNGELQIFDVTGRSVMTTTISGTESINLSAKGVYIFRLVGSEIKTQKIVVR